MTPTEYVVKLIATAGSTAPATRSTAIGRFGGATTTTDSVARARALRDVAEDPFFHQQELNKAFVLMEYFGYLRRDPDASGYNFWLAKLNGANGNYIAADMVKSFIVSGEYRQRFGP